MKDMKCYCGFLKDVNDLQKSASGGLAYAISLKTIRAGGIIYSVAFDNQFKGASYLRVDREDQLFKLRGSKYIKARLSKEILAQSKKDMLDGKHVTIIGLPCEVAIFKDHLAKDDCQISERVLFVDLVCHGPTLPKVQREFVSYLERKNKSRLIDFSLRYKNPNWNPPFVYAKFENGRTFCKKLYQTDFGIAFSIMSLSRCYECHFKGECHCSDMTIGDYWGVEPNDEGYNEKGSSVAFIHTKKSLEFIGDLSDFLLLKADREKALLGNPRYSSVSPKPPKYDSFVCDFNKYGLHKAVIRSLSIKQKIVYLLRNI